MGNSENTRILFSKIPYSNTLTKKWGFSEKWHIFKVKYDLKSSG